MYFDLIMENYIGNMSNSTFSIQSLKLMITQNFLRISFYSSNWPRLLEFMYQLLLRKGSIKSKVRTKFMANLCSVTTNKDSRIYPHGLGDCNDQHLLKELPPWIGFWFWFWRREKSVFGFRIENCVCGVGKKWLIDHYECLIQLCIILCVCVYILNKNMCNYLLFILLSDKACQYSSTPYFL